MGRLSLVGTPIGNLADITLRALEVLRAADLILAEDTRRTRTLLAHYGIATRVLSYHEHNLRSRTPRVLAELAAGRHVALVSDAGMPAISDPGGELVEEVTDQGHTVEVVPGPTAAAAAVVLSGIPAARYVFEGFLPARQGPRRRRLRELAGEPRTLVFYEAPHRVLRTLSDMREILGERRAAVSRELTKIHEETRRGRLSELVASMSQVPPRGEFTIVCEGRAAGEETAPPAVSPRELARELARLIEQEGLSRRDAVRQLAARHRLPRRDLYRLLA